MAPSHDRSRSSIDCALDLILSELDDTQVELLLREAESTVAGNIPVAKAINLFEQPCLSSLTQFQPLPLSPPPAPRRKFLKSLSPRKQTELKRRLSKRIAQKDASENGGSFDSPLSPQTSLRGYKRISPPVLSLPPSAATADLIELLVAYLTDSTTLDTPDSASATSTAMSSPTTPQFPMSPYYTDIEQSEEHDYDLLEPAPFRSLRASEFFGSPMKDSSMNMSGIFEVLDDAVLFGPRH